MSVRETIRWRRLDLPGHDAATLASTVEGWSLSGTAVFADGEMPCRLGYRIACDEAWMTLRCDVAGLVATDAVAIAIERAPSGSWLVDGVEDDRLAGCEDVDLQFTPATNLLPIRRLRLAIGATARVRSAWLRFPDLRMDVLEQIYARTGPDRYEYALADGSFRRDLTVDASGFVTDYPRLWTTEARVADVDP